MLDVVRECMLQMKLGEKKHHAREADERVILKKSLVDLKCSKWTANQNTNNLCKVEKKTNLRKNKIFILN